MRFSDQVLGLPSLSDSDLSIARQVHVLSNNKCACLVVCNICRITRELEKEARTYILQHVNIVALRAVVLELGHYGIVREYMLHGALDDFIRKYVV